MDRLNSEGIYRSDLKWVWSQRRFVLAAKKIDACLLCRRKGVNDAGLCDVCYAMLDEEEVALAEKWLQGRGP